MNNIDQIVEEMFEGHKQEVRKHLAAQWDKKIEFVKELEGKSIQEIWKMGYSGNSWDPDKRAKSKLASELLRANTGFSDRLSDPLFLRKDIEEYTKKKLERDFEMVMRQFLEKMKAKLQGVIKNHVLIDAKPTVGTWSGVIRFNFEGGWYFNMQNSIEISSNKGTVFNRFPTRFMNVNSPNGPLKNPSEAKMKAFF